MRRIVSVWLIDWPVTVWARSVGPNTPDPFAPDAGPLALILRTARGQIIHALNPAARAANLSRGQTQADALAMIPRLTCHPADPAADQRALEALAIWAERWSPSVTIDPSEGGLEGLFLDLTGATHLFGGEAETLIRIQSRLKAAGIRARAAMAPTPGAAWALARWGDAKRIATDADVRAVLAPLPIESLRITDAALKQSKRFGLKRIGDLYPMPRAGLARRFRDGAGVGLVRRLDQAIGAANEALIPTRAPPRYRGWEAYADPLGDTAGIEARLPELMDQLAQAMESDSQGARALTLTGFRVDGRTSAISVRMGRALRDVGIWMRLFREAGIERIDPGFGIDALMLTADVTEPVVALQVAMGDEDQARHAEGLAALIDRLSARLGEGAVRVADPYGSWLPERAERWRPALARRPPPEEGAGDPHRARPLMLLDPPEPVETIADLPHGAPAQFIWRRVPRKVARADGPERLSPEWWRPRPDDRLTRTRDYYRVEDDQGLRYWLFREGLYGSEYTGAKGERPPSWWMHGMFP
ncbi:DNA polymerase Y family protein [Brevundimonas sp. NIBR11]|uniref:Y-family DNA polymerase n=1 Tax=Brevundimonas sp. NIBR11 TaxID=3015999 RepID=UPI0022F07BBD|nr:DNA polymerase Y family protein [Brevundimonas sp. NIBR11]WGM29921.1 Protein ImuB [Brevundimonas sp. NIBR11]